MHGFSGSTLAEIALEVILGICIKLFCDNGRIHWRDLVNDFPMWLPGRQVQAGDGLTRQIHAMMPTPEIEEESVPTSIAAK